MNFSHPKVNFLDFKIDNLSMQETLKLVQEAISTKSDITLTDINAGKIIQMQNDEQLKKYILASDIIQADGQAVIWASKLFGEPLKERVAGIDLLENIIKQANTNKQKVFFFGAKEEVVKSVVAKFSKQYTPEIVAGYRNGYFTKNEAPKIADEIARSGAQILFIAITSPIQEHFLYHHKKALEAVNFKMGVGGSFDVFAGKTKRAPQWMQNAGLEWFYRFLQEPKRMWKRYLIGNAKFIYLVLKEKLFPSHK